MKKLLERSEKVARQRQRLLFGDRDADDLDSGSDEGMSFALKVFHRAQVL